MGTVVALGRPEGSTMAVIEIVRLTDGTMAGRLLSMPNHVIEAEPTASAEKLRELQRWCTEAADSFGKMADQL